MLQKLNMPQLEAVEYCSGPLLIIAGAGTGKTTVIANKIAYIINNKLAKPSEILAITYTEKAAREMLDRVSQISPDGALDVEFGTFHALGERILHLYGLEIGLPHRFQTLDSINTWMLVKDNWDQFSLDYFRTLGNPIQNINALIQHFQRCKDEMVSPDEYLELAESISAGDCDLFWAKEPEEKEEEAKKIIETANAYALYNKILLDNGSLDFSDLIYYSVRLLKERPNILARYRARYKYILVDEFQDTNWSQYELIKLLTKCDGGPKLTVVGDDDQSIYKFRGASVSNILQFNEDYPTSHKIVLTDNYRSCQNLLNASRDFVRQNNPDRLESKLNIDKSLVSHRVGVGDYRLIYSPNITEETKAVAAEILKIKKEKNLLWSDFAILVRANSAADPFVETFRLFNIPYDVSAPAGLLHQKSVMDALAALRSADNYRESSAIYRLLTCPAYDLPSEDLFVISETVRKQHASWYDVLKSTATDDDTAISVIGKEICKRLLKDVSQAAQNAKVESVGTVLYRFLEDSGYWKILTKHIDKYARHILHLNALFDLIARHLDSVGEVSVADFVKYVDFMVDAGFEGDLPPEPESLTGDAVQIMSVHKAKGLEFEYVFIANLVQDKFPSRNRGEVIEMPPSLIREQTLPEGDAHIQEERRLFYVAMTRAKQGLILTAAKNYGSTRDRKLSRFIQELDTANNSTFSTTPVAYAPQPQTEPSQKPLRALADNTDREYSFSQLSNYDTCPKQYYYNYVLRIPSAERGTFIFGQTIHRTLEKFYRLLMEQHAEDLLKNPMLGVVALDAPSLEKLLAIYDAEWKGEWFYSPKNRDAYYEQGKKSLEDLYKLEEKKGWIVPYAVEHKFSFSFNNRRLRGSIDRIDILPDGSLLLVDYKTGNPKTKLSDFADKRQLLIYRWAIEHAPDLARYYPPKALIYRYLNDCSELSFVPKETELERVRQETQDTIREIENENFRPTPSESVCKYCAYRNICDDREILFLCNL